MKLRSRRAECRDNGHASVHVAHFLRMIVLFEIQESSGTVDKVQRLKGDREKQSHCSLGRSLFPTWKSENNTFPKWRRVSHCLLRCWECRTVEGMARIRILSEKWFWSLGPSKVDLMDSGRKTHIWTSSLSIFFTVFTILEFTQDVDRMAQVWLEGSHMERTNERYKKNLQHVNVHLGK